MRKLLVIFLLLFPLFAHAQPELKVGQEVRFYGKFWVGNDLTAETSCQGIIAKITSKRIDLTDYCLHDKGSEFSSVVYTKNLTGYRILKPAPRPEFKLPMPDPLPNGCSMGKEGSLCREKVNIRAIADELRYLRREIEELKK